MDVIEIIGMIKTEKKFAVTFDKVNDKFDDEKFTGTSKTDPMGNLKAGCTYRVSYSEETGKYSTGGFNQLLGKVVPETDESEIETLLPDKGLISLWGRPYAFDGMMNIYDHRYGIVGTIKFENPSEEDLARRSAMLTT